METDDPMGESYSRLSEAIMKAVSQSSEIREILTGLRQNGLITQESYFNFILSLEELSVLLEMHGPGENAHELESGEGSGALPQGRTAEECPVMTENEMKFEEYYRKVFDEKEWLRKARLKF